MKPRRPTIKDSTEYLDSPGRKRKSEQVAARAARKRAAKEAKLQAEDEAKKRSREDVNQAAARIVREASDDREVSQS